MTRSEYDHIRRSMDNILSNEGLTEASLVASVLILIADTLRDLVDQNQGASVFRDCLLASLRDLGKDITRAVGERE